MKATGATAKGAVPAVATAIRILRRLSLCEAARAYEIADELGVSRSSCHCILKELVEGGLLVFDPATKAYSLGAGLIPLGVLAGEREWYIRRARPFLREWVQSIRLTIFAVRLLPDREFVVVHTVNSPHAVKLTVGVGQTFPATAPAMGGAQLAFMPQADARRIVFAGARDRLDRETSFDADGFMAELPRIKARGWARSLGQYYRNANAVAAPVLVDGHVAFVICSLGSIEDLPEREVERYGTAIRGVADRIAADIALGAERGLAV